MNGGNDKNTSGKLATDLVLTASDRYQVLIFQRAMCVYFYWMTLGHNLKNVPESTVFHTTKPFDITLQKYTLYETNCQTICCVTSNLEW